MKLKDFLFKPVRMKPMRPSMRMSFGKRMAPKKAWYKHGDSELGVFSVYETEKQAKEHGDEFKKLEGKRLTGHTVKEDYYEDVKGNTYSYDGKKVTKLFGKKYIKGSAGQIRYRVMDSETGKVKGFALSYKSADKLADKFETGGKYRYTIEKLPQKQFGKKMVTKPKAYLEDDGTLDTVISVSGNKGRREYRFNPEGRRNIKRLKEEALDAYAEDN